MLAAMAAEYSAAVAADGREGGKAYFDAVKQKYNERPQDTERAAMLVFLMHMSFCSLYSENDQGKALVYFGPTRGKVDTRFYFPAKIDRAAAYFSANDVRASCGDFEQVLQDAAAGDFVFLDPPYMGGTFTRYHAGDFTETDHLRVHAAVEELTRRGCKVLLTNANIPQVRELYHNYTQVPLTLPRTLHRKHSRAPAPHELGHHELPSSASLSVLAGHSGRQACAIRQHADVVLVATVHGIDVSGHRECVQFEKAPPAITAHPEWL